ncbi:hypothetical protein DFAR_2080007 [Desulfarculales bacterium]
MRAVPAHIKGGRIGKHREGGITVFLGSNSHLEGALKFKCQARLDGRFQG